MRSMTTFTLFFPDFGFFGKLAHILQGEGESGVVSSEFSEERSAKREHCGMVAADREVREGAGALYPRGGLGSGCNGLEAIGQRSGVLGTTLWTKPSGAKESVGSLRLWSQNDRV
jgi:hypothetical protein